MTTKNYWSKLILGTNRTFRWRSSWNVIISKHHLILWLLSILLIFGPIQSTKCWSIEDVPLASLSSSPSLFSDFDRTTRSIECPLSYSIQIVNNNYDDDGQDRNRNDNAAMSDHHHNDDGHNVTYINPKADVFFTVFLPKFDCQKSFATILERDALIYLNAIKYALNLLNEDHYDASQSSSSSPILTSPPQPSSFATNKSIKSSLPSTSILDLFPLFHSNLNRLPPPPSSSSSKRIRYGAKIIFASDHHYHQKHSIIHLVMDEFLV